MTVAERGWLDLLGLTDLSPSASLKELPSESRHYLLLLDTAGRLPATVSDLYQVMLARIEGLVGAEWTEAFSSLLAVSRNGWREDLLGAMLSRAVSEDVPAVRFAQLRRSFRAHLAERGPQRQYDFVHAQMREAVLRRYWCGTEPAEEAEQPALRPACPSRQRYPKRPR